MAAAALAVIAVGNLMRGESEARAAKYNANIAEQNAVIARQQGQVAVEAQQRDAARKIGAMVAAYGASGVQTDSGSPLDVLADSASKSTLDGLTIKYNYTLKALGFDTQAKLDRMGAKTARTSGILGGAASALQSYSASGSSGRGSGVSGTGSGGTSLPGTVDTGD